MRCQVDLPAFELTRTYYLFLPYIFNKYNQSYDFRGCVHLRIISIHPIDTLRSVKEGDVRDELCVHSTVSDHEYLTIPSDSFECTIEICFITV